MHTRWSQSRFRRQPVCLLLATLAVAWLMAGCGSAAQESTPVAYPAPVQPAATGAPTVDAPAASTEIAGPLPSLVAEIPLAPAEQTLREFALGPVANRLYVTDTSGQLHVLDASTYAVVKTLTDLGESLLVDPENRRLYVYARYTSEDEPALIYVIDTTTLEEVGTLPGETVVTAMPVSATTLNRPLGSEVTTSSRPSVSVTVKRVRPPPCA